MTDVDFKLGLLIEPEQLVPYLGHERIRIVDLSRASVYEQLHIPHAIHLQPKYLVAQQEQANGVLPDLEGLQALIEKLNISPQHHVVVYDDEGGAWAGRLIWNLHCLGFQHTSLINGGIHGWLGAGLPTTAEVDPVKPVAELLSIDLATVQQYRVEYQELLNQVEEQNIQLWDCRSNDEYTGLRLAARRGGHIPNALHFEWSTALNRENHLKLHPVSYTHLRAHET